MLAPVIRSDYDALGRFAHTFSVEGGCIRQATQRLERQMAVLQQGDWAGRGAAAFYREMESEVLPSLARLSAALECARTVTHQVSQIMRAAEDEAARILRAEGTAMEAGIGAAFMASAGLGEAIDLAQGPGGRPAASPKRGERVGVTAYETITGPRWEKGQHRDERGRVVREPDVHPSDVSQGFFGDCWLAASMAAVAQHRPDLIQNAIHRNTTNGEFNGTYTVYLYVKEDGQIKRKPFPVEPDFPRTVEQSGGRDIPREMHADVIDGERELWPLLIESAYAKAKGEGDITIGYNRMDRGMPTGEALFALTGQPSSTSSPDHYRIEELARMQREGYALVLGSLPEGSQGDRFRYRAFPNRARTSGTSDLITHHAYYITGVNEQTRMVTLRNPWGWDQPELTMGYDELRINFSDLTVNPMKPR